MANFLLRGHLLYGLSLWSRAVAMGAFGRPIHRCPVFVYVSPTWYSGTRQQLRISYFGEGSRPIVMSTLSYVGP